MHYFWNLFNKVVHMFRTGPLPIIRSISILYTRNTVQFCWCLPAGANKTSMYCVYTVLRYSWWWAVDLSETCRVLYQINSRNSASRAFYYKNISTMLHGPLDVKKKISFAWLHCTSTRHGGTCFSNFISLISEGLRW